MAKTSFVLERFPGLGLFIQRVGEMQLLEQGDQDMAEYTD